ncbi:MAG: hypothetical protein WB987_13675 [Candidatus Acidiferrales bacterium]
MNQRKRFLHARRREIIAAAIVSSLMLFAWHFYAYGQNRSDFPDGYDAVEAAPATHKVVFENEIVRVLEVTVPPPGTTIPMHHHRWPSFFLDWDTGGATPHIRYRRPDGSVKDNPSRAVPVHPGSWSVQWMKPEPMHSIEVVEKPESSVQEGPPSLRIEIKCHP